MNEYVIHKISQRTAEMQLDVRCPQKQSQLLNCKALPVSMLFQWSIEMTQCLAHGTWRQHVQIVSTELRVPALEHSAYQVGV